MPILLRKDRINLTSPENQPGTSAVGVGRLNHLATFHGPMTNSRQPTKLSVLSVALPSPTSKLDLLSLALLLPHWFSTKCSHGSLFHSHRGSPHLQQIHTQASAENCTHPQQSVHILQPHCSYILYPSHSTRNS